MYMDELELSKDGFKVISDVRNLKTRKCAFYSHPILHLQIHGHGMN